MFSFSKHETPSSKCYFTHSTLPAYVDEKNPPTKKKPFSTFLSQPFIHTVDLILPEEVYEIVKRDLEGDAGTWRYSRVNMSLSEIIDGEFFNQYIKAGNILMLSEGRPGVDNVYSLRDGVLKLELDRATYERCGLVGTPIQGYERKHKKSRFLVELNLRLPSMLHGKKGFERIVWAFKNVLNASLSWLFIDLNAADSSAGPITKHHPLQKTIQPECTRVEDALVPPIASLHDMHDQIYAEELQEWLGLVALDSPRIRADDSIDSFLSRYEVPTFGDDEAASSPPQPRNLVQLRWHGFASPKSVTALWMLTRKAVGKDWAAMSVCAFGGKAYTVFGLGAQETLTWEYD